MEELLNKLIQKGWKPFEDIDIAEFNQIGNTFVAINYESKVIGQPKLRQIVSKESGLWQFVCENKLRNPIGWDYHRKQGLPEEMFDEEEDYMCDGPEYRLIESALCDEDRLEQFLLDNIKI